MKKNWKIYIDYGTSKEFAYINALKFNTKSEASKWAKENGYYQKSVMDEATWNEMKNKNEDIVVSRPYFDKEHGF